MSSRNRSAQARPGNRNGETHGLRTMKRALTELGGRAIDGRSTVAKTLATWRRDLIADLGGAEHLSTQRAAIVDLCVREKLLLDSVDNYLLDLRGGIINRRKRSLLPVVRERAQLADSFTRRLVALGLERKVGEAPDLSTYLASRVGRRTQPMGVKSADGREAEQGETDENLVDDLTGDGEPTL